MTKAPTPTEKSKKQRDNVKNANKNFYYTTIADQLRTSKLMEDRKNFTHFVCWTQVDAYRQKVIKLGEWVVAATNV